jgi:hypothetical protein
LQPETASPEAITHPYRLYELLCQATRLYFDLDPLNRPTDPTMMHNLTDFWAEFDCAHSGIEAGATAAETWEASGSQTHGLYDWCQDSQHMMGLLSEDVMFWSSTMTWLSRSGFCAPERRLADAFTS